MLQYKVSLELLVMMHRISEIQQLLKKANMQTLPADELNCLHNYRPEDEFHEAFNCLQQLQLHSSPLESWLCLSLVVFTNMTFNVMQFGMLWQRVKILLSDAVSKPSQLSGYGNDGLIRAMMMASWSWEGRLGLAIPGRKLLLLMLANPPKTRSWEGMRKILQEFFWNHEWEDSLQRCWQQVARNFEPDHS